MRERAQLHLRQGGGGVVRPVPGHVGGLADELPRLQHPQELLLAALGDVGEFHPAGVHDEQARPRLPRAVDLLAALAPDRAREPGHLELFGVGEPGEQRHDRDAGIGLIHAAHVTRQGFHAPTCAAGSRSGAGAGGTGAGVFPRPMRTIRSALSTTAMTDSSCTSIPPARPTWRASTPARRSTTVTSAIAVFWRMTAAVARATTRAPTSWSRRSVMRMTSALAWETSVPAPPIATPTSASARAGASLTPSPTMMTRSPRSRACPTSRALSWGNRPACTSVIPTWLATWVAAAALSAVRIAMRSMPAFLREVTADAASVRGWSATAIAPSSSSPRVTYTAVIPASSQSRAEAMRSAAAWPGTRCSGSLPTWTGSPSTIPLTPIPGTTVTLSTGRSAKPCSSPAETIARARWCSLAT